MIVDHFHVAARRDYSLHGSFCLIRVAGCDDPKLECATTRGCRSGGLYPDEECFSHSLNMARLRATANLPVEARGPICARIPKRPATFPAERCGIAFSSITCKTQRENFPANREIGQDELPKGAGAGQSGDFVTNPDSSLTDLNVPIMLPDLYSTAATNGSGGPAPIPLRTRGAPRPDEGASDRR